MIPSDGGDAAVVDHADFFDKEGEHLPVSGNVYKNILK